MENNGIFWRMVEQVDFYCDVRGDEWAERNTLVLAFICLWI